MANIIDLDKVHEACVFLVDTSNVVSIEKLNEGLQAFQEALDETCPSRGSCADICVIGFDKEVKTLMPFCPLGEFRIPKLHLSEVNGCVMNEAIITGLDMIEALEQEYKSLGVRYWRPWMLLMTDGVPTDSEYAAYAKECLQEAFKAKKIDFYPMGIGEEINTAHLESYTRNGSGMVLKADKRCFKEILPNPWLQAELEHELHGDLVWMDDFLPGLEPEIIAVIDFDNEESSDNKSLSDIPDVITIDLDGCAPNTSKMPLRKKISCVLLVNTSSIMKPYEEELIKQIRVFVDTWRAVLTEYVEEHEATIYHEDCYADMDFSIIQFDNEARTVFPMSSINEFIMPTIEISEVDEANLDAAIKFGVQEIWKSDTQMDSNPDKVIKMMYLFSNGDTAKNRYDIMHTVTANHIRLWPMHIGDAPVNESMRAYTKRRRAGVLKAEAESFLHSVPWDEIEFGISIDLL